MDEKLDKDGRPVGRRGRPSRALNNIPRGLVAEMFEPLVQAAVRGLLEGGQDNNVIMRFHHLTTLPKGFPKGVLRKDGDINEYRVRAYRLLHWLHDNGHTHITPLKLRQQAIVFGVTLDKEIDFDLYEPPGALQLLDWTDDPVSEHC